MAVQGYSSWVERSPASLFVVFDVGGVLVPAEGAVAELAVASDAPAAVFEEAYWAGRDLYDAGGAKSQFWQGVAATCGFQCSDLLIDTLDRKDAIRWSRVSDGAQSLLADLDACGVGTAVLSNAPASLATMVRQAEWSRRFYSLLFSSDVGYLKPSPDIYEIADQIFGTAQSTVLFFDDRPANVAAGRRHGWDARLWTGLDEARGVFRDEYKIAGAGAL